MSTQEYSESGIPIHRYENHESGKFTPATGDGENIEAISDHIEKHIGTVDIVLHEIVSDLVHIDVHWVKPTKKFPFHSFVTSGMSDKPMTVPKGMEAHRYAELCIFLPTTWSLYVDPYQTTEEAFKDENNYWPIRWLKKLARFPHEFNTWFGRGHTMSNGENAEPFAANTQFVCMALFSNISIGCDFSELRIDDEKTIRFYCLFPLYKEEMELKLEKGTDALINGFKKFRVTDIVDIDRPNITKKRGLFGLW